VPGTGIENMRTYNGISIYISIINMFKVAIEYLRKPLKLALNYPTPGL
jgi:hypothetical protein